MLQTSCFVSRSAEEIKDSILNTTAFRPTLGIIFSSVRLGIPELTRTASSFGIPVFGCSTAGEILATPEGPPVYEQSAVCCLLDLPASFFSVKLFERDKESCFAFGQRIGAWGMEVFSKPAFIITVAGLENDGEAIIRGMEAICPEGTMIYGGLAGDDGLLKETFVFSHTGHSSDGAVVTVFDQSKVTVRGIATSGWTGVGAEMVITSSEGNVVSTINGRPALDVVREYLNVSDEEVLQIAVNFPLLIKRADGTEVLRTIFAADYNKRSVTFAGTVPNGARVRFSSSFGYETIEQAIRDLRDYFPRQTDADLVLIFSCMARFRAAGPMVNDEIMAASQLWKRPLIGFFTYGEIGHNRYGTCEFYNESLSLVLIHIRPGPV